MGGSPQGGEVPSLPRITVTMVEFGVCATYTLVQKPCARVHLTLREVEGDRGCGPGYTPSACDTNVGLRWGGTPKGTSTVVSVWVSQVEGSRRCPAGCRILYSLRDRASAVSCSMRTI